MPREFDVPSFYRSKSVLAVKQARKARDPKKRDVRPSVLDFGPVRFKLARHFGFCFGVENAIEIAYRVLEEHPDKRIFLLSEVIHNPQVNADLLKRGVRFLMNTDGTREIDFQTLSKEDIVIVPAFGTTVELQEELSQLGIDPYRYDATCPFVEKVWKRSTELGKKDFTVIIHGKRAHEETRATFSHSSQAAPTLVVRDMADAQKVISYMRGDLSLDSFTESFAAAMSSDFDAKAHLQRVGVVNQTTMLASDTQAIARAFRDAMVELYGDDNLKDHFADTRDTLCYATYENQSATAELSNSQIDIALVVGGYNSSNTSHLVELCEEKTTTFYIKGADEILSPEHIRHFNLHKKQIVETKHWLPQDIQPLTIAITAGASCPDRAVDDVIQKILSFYSSTSSFDEALKGIVQNDELAH